FVTRMVTGKGEGPRITDEEVLMMVKLGSRTGHFKPHEAEVIQNILALEARTAKDVMTPRSVVFALRADATVGDVRDEEPLLNFSRIPVYGDNLEDIVGIVHRRDILTAIGDDRFGARLREIMRPVHFVLDATPLDALLRTFLARRQHLVVVIDQAGTLIGIATLEDVLEEILGSEIVDEFDQVEDLQEYARRQRAAVLRGQGAGRPS
ncbi:MAG: CBS domain-containing protein, partial [Myxococcota bacterium]